jgi:hypothetical protein
VSLSTAEPPVWAEVGRLCGENERTYAQGWTTISCPLDQNTGRARRASGGLPNSITIISAIAMVLNPRPMLATRLKLMVTHRPRPDSVESTIQGTTFLIKLQLRCIPESNIDLGDFQTSRSVGETRIPRFRIMGKFCPLLSGLRVVSDSLDVTYVLMSERFLHVMHPSRIAWGRPNNHEVPNDAMLGSEGPSRKSSITSFKRALPQGQLQAWKERQLISRPIYVETAQTGKEAVIDTGRKYMTSWRDDYPETIWYSSFCASIFGASQS